MKFSTPKLCVIYVVHFNPKTKKRRKKKGERKIKIEDALLLGVLTLYIHVQSTFKEISLHL